jgi:hypothetical protein
MGGRKDERFEAASKSNNQDIIGQGCQSTGDQAQNWN